MSSKTLNLSTKNTLCFLFYCLKVYYDSSRCIASTVSAFFGDNLILIAHSYPENYKEVREKP